MEYKDCIIVTNNNQAIVLRATRAIVDNNNSTLFVYDNDDIIAVFSMSEVKAVIIAYLGDAEAVRNIIDAITNRKYDCIGC